MTQPLLCCRDLRKSFGTVEVLKGIDLEVMPGERIAIIGGSGSGKSTFLRCLNFMELPSAGTIVFEGRRVGLQKGDEATGRAVYPERMLMDLRRRIGMVFQQFNLFPHLTALENVMEGPVAVRRLPRRQARALALEQLDGVGLAAKAEAYPAQLSGGQQQRVAIARALAMEPEVILFDEPTSSLDPELVGEVLRTILALAGSGRTMLLVTHELGFAYRFATRVLFFHDGKIHEEGTAEQIFRAPRDERTRAFIARSSEFSL